jgi:uncharacterized protein (TIGR02246 family)
METERKARAKQIYSQWFELLSSGKVSDISALYADDADFLPTFSSQFVCDKAGIRSYFEHFCAKHPEGKIISDSIRFLTDECFVHAGFYDFEVGETEERHVVHARFTFVWRQTAENVWKILHHHSSVLP